MKFTQFVQQYLANNKNSGLTYREAMKDDGVRCAYKQFEADMCKKGIVRKPEKRPEPKKRYNKDSGCGDNVINQYINNSKENVPPKWSPAPTGPPPQSPSQKPGFPPPPPTAPKGSYQHDPFQQMAQNPYWQRNPALLAQARRQYEEAMSQASQVRDTAEREQPPAPEFLFPPESIDGEIPESSITSPPISTTTIPTASEDSSKFSAPSGLSETTDGFEFNQSIDPDEESAGTPAPFTRDTEKPKVPPALRSMGVKEGPQRTKVKVEDVPEQELLEIIDEELMNSQAAVSRERVMQELMKAKEDSRSGLVPVQTQLQPGGVRFTDEEEATKLIGSIFDIVMDEALEDGGKWTAMLGSVPAALKSVAREKRRAEGKDKKTRRNELLDGMMQTVEKYGPVMKALMERVAEDARQAREREAERKVRRLEKKKTSKDRREDSDEVRKRPNFGTREYRQQMRQLIRDGINRHTEDIPSRGVRPISETMQYRPDVPFAYRYTPQRGVIPEDITRSLTSGVRRDRARLGLNERNDMEDMEIEGLGLGRKGKLKELISALIDVI